MDKYYMVSFMAKNEKLAKVESFFMEGRDYPSKSEIEDKIYNTYPEKNFTGAFILGITTFSKKQYENWDK